ncbi:MAG TPA: efflux RND transporter permease subunit, partial [Bacteroidales bacterium]|nr:efflux RND transporter permease subunit [Bacteroidales bacterium]
VLVFNLRASILISGLLPMAVLMTFIVMRLTGVDANIVALSGIAIAIGVMVDVGIVFVENMIRHLEMPENQGVKRKALQNVILRATTEVSPAIITALSTTVVSFLPVFAMEATEGKLFKPLAYTKTFALIASFVLGIIVLPLLSHFIFSIKFEKRRVSQLWNIFLMAAGVVFIVIWGTWPALALSLIGINNFLSYKWPKNRRKIPDHINIGITLMVALYYLTHAWLPLGAHNSFLVNFLFVAGLVAFVLTLLTMIIHFYEPILRWCLTHKWKFLAIPFITVLLGITIWLGFDRIFGFAASGFGKAGWELRKTGFWQNATKIFPGVGKEFMPALDEGSFLLMPTSMPHTGIEQNIEYVKTLDKRLASIPEVETAVGKWGRVTSALDPAPVQMFENTINYKPEYVLDENGHRRRFKTDKAGYFLIDLKKVRNEVSGNKIEINGKKVEGDKIDINRIRGIKYDRENGKLYVLIDKQWEQIQSSPSGGLSQLIMKNVSFFLIPDNNGEYFRQWRPQIKKPDDIWNEIVKVTNLPGLTSAPKLQPIQTRLIMLSTGMRAPLGLKVYGPDLETIEKSGLEFEKILKEVPSIIPSSVFYDRAVGAPYIEIKLKREAIARYGMTISDVQEALQSAVGGMGLTTTVEGRERFPVRVRYARELRNTPEELEKILVPSMTGVQVPLGELAEMHYTRGPQMIRSENTFLTGYVIFDKQPGVAEVDVVEKADAHIKAKIESGELKLPTGVSYKFAGNYEQQIRATKRLALVIPVSLILVFLLLFFQFKTITASSIHFSGVFVAFAGGFLMLWLYGQPWFMNFSIAGMNMRDLFQMHTINLSVAVWVGFIALFGIATDDGVIMGTYIHQVFEEMKPATVHDVREAVVIAGKKRVRPAMMTAAVAIIALLPVLTSTGKGADIMVPMAIPTFGGMIIQMMTMFVVPVLQAIWRESGIKKTNGGKLKHIETS